MKLSAVTHRGSLTATGAGCGERWPHKACLEPPGSALSSRKCASSPHGGWRCAADALYGGNMPSDLVWHSWHWLSPWGCLSREECSQTKSICSASPLWILGPQQHSVYLRSTAAGASCSAEALDFMRQYLRACPDSHSPTEEMSPYCSSPSCPRCVTSIPLLLMVVALFNTVRDKSTLNIRQSMKRIGTYCEHCDTQPTFGRCEHKMHYLPGSHPRFAAFCAGCVLTWPKKRCLVCWNPLRHS